MKLPISTSLLLLSACLLALSACSRDGGAQKERRAEATPVTVTAVTNVAWDKTTAIIGTLYAKDEAIIAAQVEGMVERTLVDFGDRVRSNQSLAFIDTASYEAQLQQTKGALAKAEANYTNAVQNFARVEELKKKGIASASDFDQARAQLGEWEAEVKAARGTEGVAQLNVERSQVRAPYDGAISQRVVGRGDYVKPGSPLFNIVSDGVLKFIFQVPERYASYVEKKLPVSFSVDNYPGEAFTGTTYLISPAVSMASRAFGVGALVTNTDFRLKANTFARGTLVLERGVPTPVVPIEAVVSFAGVTKVFVIEGNVARGRAVVVGRIRDGMQEIVEGLKPGEQVVVSGQSRLSDGAAVAVQTAAPALTNNGDANPQPASR
ncbi:MAG TPA: efflux RND transporter periplasmic adaptor subunit [Verrucomicrobiae bacterium]|jgi:membrane fusion protein (multidrug efflux system)